MTGFVKVTEQVLSVPNVQTLEYKRVDTKGLFRSLIYLNSKVIGTEASFPGADSNLTGKSTPFFKFLSSISS